ncbi:MAG TPA: hypothetical protein VGO81_13265 [Solirubrobacteraceae bacterium]|nr:hypothetical protein [Solirubrobacteraceae bacterium]
MRRLLILIAAFLAVPAGTAHAGVFPGDAIDGPSPDVQSLSDLELARDGSGALAYLKRVSGVDQVFVARFTGGAFVPGERIDTGLPAASSQPVVGAADAERLVVVFVNGGTVYGVVRPPGQGYAAPVALGPGSDPAVDLSINGAAYASYTSNGDVRIARLDRNTSAWSLLPQPADVDPARPAGVGSGRSRVAISADGVGIVTWGEAGHVYARKMFGSGLSNAPQDLTPAAFEDRAATTSDFPDVDAEDDSSYAWVVFRQTFVDGGARILARRERGTAFDPPVAVDMPGIGPLEPNIELNGRGVGLATTPGAATSQPAAALLHRDIFGTATPIFSASASAPPTVPAMSENDDGLVASVISAPGAAPSAQLLVYDKLKPATPVVISRPELGAVDAARGFDASIDRASGGVVAWVQGGTDDRRIVAGYLDRPPGRFVGYTAARCCQPALARLSWQPSFNLWGALHYQVHVDGKLAGETEDTKLQLTVPLKGALHHWQVTAVDGRGQTRRSRTRLLRVDDLAPRLSVGYTRAKRVVSISARGRDLGGTGHRSSGIRDVVVVWGDATPRAVGTARLRVRHRYARAGTYALEVRARDMAGNVDVFKRTVRIG